MVSKMGLKVYVDLMSQPCRALVIFLRANQVPHEECLVNLRKGEHLTDEYKAVNPFQKVPAIDHDGFKLTETVAIFRYLTHQFPIAEHWYPSDVKKRARVDEYMAWQHNNLRFYGSMVFWTRVLRQPLDEKRLEKNISDFENCLERFSEAYLGKAPFVNGAADITLADLLAVCELEQPMVAGYDLNKKFPQVQEYVSRVQNRVGPIYGEAHKIAYMVKERVSMGKL